LRQVEKQSPTEWAVQRQIKIHNAAVIKLTRSLAKIKKEQHLVLTRSQHSTSSVQDGDAATRMMKRRVDNSSDSDDEEGAAASAANMAQQFNEAANALLSWKTARFKDSCREIEFLHQRITKEKMMLWKKFVSMCVLACLNGSYAVVKGHVYGFSQFLIALTFVPMIIAIPFRASAQTIRHLTIATNFLFGMALTEIQVAHYTGLPELNAGTNPKCLMLTVIVTFIVTFSLSPLTWPDKMCLNALNACCFYAISIWNRDIFFDATRACPECITDQSSESSRWDEPDESWSLQMSPASVIVCLAFFI
jgi:hypothetical protein